MRDNLYVLGCAQCARMVVEMPLINQCFAKGMEAQTRELYLEIHMDQKRSITYNLPA